LLLSSISNRQSQAMKQITLNIADKKFKAFIEFIKTLDYVSISKEEEIPQWQQEEVKERLELVDKGQMKTRSWDEAEKDIFKK